MRFIQIISLMYKNSKSVFKIIYLSSTSDIPRRDAELHKILQWRQYGHNGISNHGVSIFTQLLVQAQIKENTKALLHWSLRGEFTGEMKRKMFPRHHGKSQSMLHR